MSIKLMSKMWENGPKTQSQLLVILAIADYANDEGFAWPSIASIAQKSRITERSAQRIIRALEAEGWLQIVTGGGRHGCNQYIVNPDTVSPPTQCHPRHSKQKPRHSKQKTLTPVSPEPSRTIKEPPIGEKQPVEVLSEVLSRDVAEGFFEMRKAIKKPLTPYAAKLIVDQLRGNPMADEIVSESIKFSWQGIFPDKFAPKKASAEAAQIARWERMGR